MASKLSKIINAAGMLTLMVGTAYAAIPQPAITVEKPSGFVIEDIGLLITNIVWLFLIIAAILVFFYLVWGGLQWITSGGDKQATQAARDRIGAALVGLAIVATGWALYQIVQYFFQIDTSNIPTAITTN